MLDAELPDAGERELIGVSVALECASEEHYAMLLSELELRLPQDVTLITGQSAEVLTKRQIAWRWDALSGCALQLSDERGAVEMPLAPQPSQDQLQQTVMRLAWFVSNPDEELVMTPERAASAPRATAAARRASGQRDAEHPYHEAAVRGGDPRAGRDAQRPERLAAGPIGA